MAENKWTLDQKPEVLGFTWDGESNVERFLTIAWNTYTKGRGSRILPLYLWAGEDLYKAYVNALGPSLKTTTDQSYETKSARMGIAGPGRRLVITPKGYEVSWEWGPLVKEAQKSSDQRNEEN